MTDSDRNFETNLNISDSLYAVFIDVLSYIHIYLTKYAERFQTLSLHGQILTILIAWLFINILLINLAWKIYGSRICDPSTAGSPISLYVDNIGIYHSYDG